MSFQLIQSAAKYICLSGDTKDTTVKRGSTVYETDTEDWFIFDGSAWQPYTPPGVGGGSSTSAPSGEILFGNAGGDGVTSDPLLKISRGFSGSLGIGAEALVSEIEGAAGNTALGIDAVASTTTGVNNTGVGYRAVPNNTTGDKNAGIGAGTLLTTTGNRNVAVGAEAMNANTDYVTGDDNVAIGYEAGKDISSGSRNIAIGKGVDVADGEDDDQLNIGDLITGNMASGSKQATIDGRLVAKAPDSAIADGDLIADSFSVYRDGDDLKIKVKQTNGTTIKTYTLTPDV